METKNIYQKLFEFKDKEITLKKDKKAFNYSYATLWQIQTMLAPILKELNLLIIHFNKDGKVITQIRCLESNTFIESETEIWKVESTRTEQWIEKKWRWDKGKTIDINTIEYNDKDPQWVWSIITYYRRYHVIEMLDLEIEDDDANTWGQRAKNDYNRQEKEEWIVYSWKHNWDNWFNDKHIDTIKDMLWDWKITIDKLAEYLMKEYSISNEMAKKLNDFIEKCKEKN